MVLLGLVHFGKRESADSGKLILGSIAWSQVARSVLSVAEDTETGNRVLTNTKANFTARARSVECRIVGKIVDTVHGPSEIGAVEWLGDTDKDARDYLADHEHDTGRDVDEWLTRFLADAPQKANDVYSAADAAGYSKDQAKRAKKRLGVEAAKMGFSDEGPWFWRLANEPNKPENVEAKGSTDLGSTPLARGSAPFEAGRSLAGQSVEKTAGNARVEHREQRARERPLCSEPIAPGGLTPNSPGQTDRMQQALARARGDGHHADRDAANTAYIQGLCAECHARPCRAGGTRCDDCFVRWQRGEL